MFISQDYFGNCWVNVVEHGYGFNGESLEARVDCVEGACISSSSLAIQFLLRLVDICDGCRKPNYQVDVFLNQVFFKLFLVLLLEKILDFEPRLEVVLNLRRRLLFVLYGVILVVQFSVVLMHGSGQGGLSSNVLLKVGNEAWREELLVFFRKKFRLFDFLILHVDSQSAISDVSPSVGKSFDVDQSLKILSTIGVDVSLFSLHGLHGDFFAKDTGFVLICYRKVKLRVEV